MASSSLRRAVGRSLDSIHTPSLEAVRLDEINEVSNPVKRLGLLSVHAGVRSRPQLFANLFDFRLRPDLVRIGEGKQSTVYRTADMVLKIIKEGEGGECPKVLTDRERNNRAAKLKEEHLIMTDYLGTVVLPHAFQVNQHPLVRGRDAIIISQPFRELDLLDLGTTTDEVEVVAHKLATVNRTYPGSLDELAPILANSRQMAEAESLWTDVVGQNIGVSLDSDRLIVVDSQPVAPSSLDYQLAEQRFGVLEQALAMTI